VVGSNLKGLITDNIPLVHDMHMHIHLKHTRTVSTVKLSVAPMPACFGCLLTQFTVCWYLSYEHTMYCMYVVF
jgi:hypothetical protein